MNTFKKVIHSHRAIDWQLWQFRTEEWKKARRAALFRRAGRFAVGVFLIVIIMVVL